jgi:polyhydroxyalkanoate synthesis regulator phasin
VFYDFDEDEFAALIEEYKDQFKGLTDEQKEELLIELVTTGEITADEAVALAISEGLDLDS